MIEEIWKPVVNYEKSYEVSNLGAIRGIDREIYTPLIGNFIKKGKIIIQSFDSSGYCQVGLSGKGVKKTTSVHKIVAYAFIDNPKNLPQVNHIDGNKLNNKVDNLEWCTNQENQEHARETGLYEKMYKEAMKRRKPVIAYNEKSSISFTSISSAAKHFNFNSGSISSTINRKNNIFMGYFFEYI